MSTDKHEYRYMSTGMATYLFCMRLMRVYGVSDARVEHR